MRTHYRNSNSKKETIGLVLKALIAAMLVYLVFGISTIIHDQRYIMNEDQDLLNMGRQLEEIEQHIRFCRESVGTDCWAEVESDGAYEILWKVEE